MTHYFRTTLAQAREVIEAIEGHTDPTDYRFENAEIGEALFANIRGIEANNERTEGVIAGLEAQDIYVHDRWFTLNDVVFSINASNQVDAVWAYNAERLRAEIGNRDNAPNLDALAPSLDDGANQPDHIGDYIYVTENGRWNEENYRTGFAHALGDAATNIQVEQLVTRLDATVDNPATGFEPGRGLGEGGSELPGEQGREETEDPTILEPPPEPPGGEGGGLPEPGEFE